MFGSGNFGINLPSCIFENFEIALTSFGQFQNFQKYTRVIYPKFPSQTCDYQYKLLRILLKIAKMNVRKIFNSFVKRNKKNVAKSVKNSKYHKLPLMLEDIMFQGLIARIMRTEIARIYVAKVMPKLQFAIIYVAKCNFFRRSFAIIYVAIINVRNN